MDDRPDQVLFDESELNNIIEEHDATKSAKYKLEAAGMTKGETKIGKVRHRFWIREGHRMVTKSGVPAVILYPDGMEKPVKDGLPPASENRSPFENSL